MMSRRWLRAIGLLSAMACAVVFTRPVHAGLALGDVNCDGQVDSQDLDALINRLFGRFGTCSNPDVNGDDLISAADLTSLLPLLPPPSPTETPTETPTGQTPDATETPTDTPVPTATDTVEPITPPPGTATRTPSRTRTGTVTRTPTRTPTGEDPVTPTETETPVGPETPTPTETPTEVSEPGTPTRTRRPPTATRTATRTRTPSVTRTASNTRPPTATPTETRTPTITRTRTVTRTPTTSRTPTATRTSTNTRPPTATRTSTFTRTPSPTRTPTKPLPPGPQITHFGLATADNRIITPTSFRMIDTEMVPVYNRRFGFGFLIVVEGRPGNSRRPLSEFGTDDLPTSPPGKADLWLISDTTLGNGSGEICDEGPTLDNPQAVAGGVPAATSFDDVAAIDDFACRFVYYNSSEESCTFDELGNFDFVSPLSTAQYCSGPSFGPEVALPSGSEATFTVRLRDSSGALGDIARLIIVTE